MTKNDDKMTGKNWHGKKWQTKTDMTKKMAGKTEMSKKMTQKNDRQN